MEQDNSIQLDLSEEDMENMIRIFISSTVSAISQEHFEKILHETNGDFKEALWAAAINEVANLLLEKYVDQIKQADDGEVEE